MECVASSEIVSSETFKNKWDSTYWGYFKIKDPNELDQMISEGFS